MVLAECVKTWKARTVLKLSACARNYLQYTFSTHAVTECKFTFCQKQLCCFLLPSVPERMFKIYSTTALVFLNGFSFHIMFQQTSQKIILHWQGDKQTNRFSKTQSSAISVSFHILIPMPFVLDLLAWSKCQHKKNFAAAPRSGMGRINHSASEGSKAWEHWPVWPGIFYVEKLSKPGIYFPIHH